MTKFWRQIGSCGQNIGLKTHFLVLKFRRDQNIKSQEISTQSVKKFCSYRQKYKKLGARHRGVPRVKYPFSLKKLLCSEIL